MTKPPARKPVAKPVRQPVHEAPVEHGAEPASAAQGLLAGLFAGLDAAREAAQERVDQLEEELRLANRDLAAVNALQSIRDGRTTLGDSQPTRKPRGTEGASGGGSGRGPRGETGAKVLAKLTDAPGGMGASAIIQKLGATDPKEIQSIRNFLSSGQKNGTVHYDKSVKLYRKA